MKVTRWFNVTGGISKVDAETVRTSQGEAIQLTIATDLFRRGAKQPVFRQEETAVISDRGLESFEIVETGEDFKSRTTGERRGSSLVVSTSGSGFEGRLTIDAKSFDISSYELLLLERDDLSELAREPFRLFDADDLEVYVAQLRAVGQTLHMKGQRIKVQRALLNVEGAEFEFVILPEGELFSMRGTDFAAVLATEAQVRQRRAALTARVA